MWWDPRNPGMSQKKNFPFYGTVDFLTCLLIPENRTQKYSKPTSTAFWSCHSRKFSKMKVLFFSIFSKFCLKKIFILWHSGLLDMFFCRSPKTALKNIQNSHLCSILKLTSLKIFKNKSFCFSQFSRNFFSTSAWVLHRVTNFTFLTIFKRTSFNWWKNFTRFLRKFYSILKEILSNFQENVTQFSGEFHAIFKKILLNSGGFHSIFLENLTLVTKPDIV